MDDQEVNEKIAAKKKFMDENIEHLRERLTVTRSKIMRTAETKFMVNEILQLPTHFKADLPMPTAGTDGKQTFIDPEFWIKINLNQRVMVLCHETMHVMFGHTDKRRKGAKADHLWNIACDCVVQAMLSMCKIGEKIEGTIWPDNSYSGHITLQINGTEIKIDECHLKTVEDVFQELIKHAKKNPPPKGKGKGTGQDEFMDANGNKVGPLDNHELGELSKEEREQVKDMLRRKIVEHKMRGNMPGWLAEKIEGMIKGKVNWQAELREMVTPEIKTYSTFSKTNRRSGACGVILPGKYREGLDVAIAIDTSGSIGKNELKYFIGEIYNIFSQFEQVKAKILLHTSKVYSIIDVGDTKQLENIEYQTGGTCHLDVFEKVKAANARVLINLTDGWSSFPEQTKVHKIIWVCTEEEGSKQIPENLGKVIVVDPADLNNE